MDRADVEPAVVADVFTNGCKIFELLAIPTDARSYSSRRVIVFGAPLNHEIAYGRTEMLI